MKSFICCISDIGQNSPHRQTREQGPRFLFFRHIERNMISFTILLLLSRTKHDNIYSFTLILQTKGISIDSRKQKKYRAENHNPFN